MAEEEKPLLRGRIERSEHYQATRGGGGGDITLPPRDPPKYRGRLLAELDAVVSTIATQDRDADASRVIVAAIPLDPTLGVPGDPLADKRSDARVVGADPDTRVVVLDLADPRAEHLRRKLEDFVDDTKIGKTGRKHEPLFARLEHLRVASHAELAGPEALALPEGDEQQRWFEIGCRGGVRARAGETLRSRSQMHRQLKAVGIDSFEEYEATEQLVFFARASLPQVTAIAQIVDCVYEYELAAPDVRDWLTHEHATAKSIQGFALTPPPEGAPAVALLDTGVATQHPMLKEAIRLARSVVPNDSSPEDTHDHGTETAGIALYSDLGGAVARGNYEATH